MKKNLAVGMVLLFLLLSPIFSQNEAEFKLVGQWKHEEIVGRDFFSYIDKDNHLVASLGRAGNLIITPDKVIKFAAFGQSPDELITLKTAFFYKGDLAMVELAEKIKIFTKKGETYRWKETKWLKRGPWVHFIKEGLFFDNKFFLSGMEGIYEEKGPLKSFYKAFFHLKVYAENGDCLKQLIRKPYDGPTLVMMMRYHLASYAKDRVFYLPENELKLLVISSKTLEVVKEVQLEVPSYYKKMPSTYYAWSDDQQQKSPAQQSREYEDWQTGYSAVQEMVVDGKYLVIQIRTEQEKLKKFALLFYNAENFKLERTVFLDDFLFDVKDGKYYTYANGNPAIDEDTDDCIINIYAFEKKK